MKNQKYKTILNYLILVISALLLWGIFTTPVDQNQIPYSEMKQKIRSGAFSKVKLTEKLVVGELKDTRTKGQSDKVEKEDSQKSKVQSLASSSKTLVSTRLDNDPELIKLLDETATQYEVETKNTMLASLLYTILPLLLFFMFWTFAFRKAGPGSEMMRFGKSKGKVKAESDLKLTFDDVAGQDEAKEELNEIVEFLSEPERFTRLGGKLPKGILLVGPPGTGKTLLSKAVAGEAKVPFFHISGSEFVEMFVGVGAARVRDLFIQAKAKAPCIIFIDELDAVGKARGVGAFGGHDEREQTLNQLLVEMDGFDSKVGVIIMAATNRPETLDPALLRAGRFDRQVLVGRPDLKEREAILELHAKKVKLDNDVNLETVAKGTPGMVGADLANVVNEAALLAARSNAQAVHMKHFNDAVERILAGLEKKKRVINKHEKQIVAHHEAGHALIAALKNSTDKVHKISIVPRGVGALGYTLQLPTEDRYLMTKQELLNKIDVLLGGQASESIIFGDISTGASDDLSRATEIARSMVTQYGMGKTLGPATVERERNALYMDQSGASIGKNFSEETARQIDEEIKTIMKDRMTMVKALLTEKLVILKEIATTLLEKEVLDDEQFQAILTRHGILGSSSAA
ncbi:MAG: ATP-dependent zinc metalloprotease FtsH [Bdellovibrionales bacterium]|nr:ATP-dependent zinc metalloprotease FtsH [Bdellovibrionales bacterium]